MPMSNLKSCECRSCATDPIKYWIRWLLGFFVAAVVTAAALRHLLHVPREQIRNPVLRTAAIAIFLAVVLFRWKRRPRQRCRADVGFLVLHGYRNARNMLAADTRQPGRRLQF